MTDRTNLVIHTAYNVEKFHVGAVPFDVELLCRKMGIAVLPLSYFLANGGTERGFFALVGNEDGAALHHGGISKILYNDKKPRRRVRFTLAEELSHVLLHHVEDRRFDVAFAIDERIYEQYEREAKCCAGLILMSPPLYYRLRGGYTLSQLAALFDLSIEATYRAAKFCDEHEDEIRAVYGDFAPFCKNIRNIQSRLVPKRAVSI